MRHQYLLAALTFVSCDREPECAHTPKSGAWTIASTLDANMCGNGASAPADAVSVDMNEYQSFEFSGRLLGGVASLFCLHGDDSFSCARVLLDEVVDGDTVVSLYASLSGLLISGWELSGSLRVQFECDGSDCAALATANSLTQLPCEYTYSFTATAGSDTYCHEPAPPSGSGGSGGTPPSSCCKTCTDSKPCGGSCISWSKECHVGPGCAC